jgi:hypothetical protein
MRLTHPSIFNPCFTICAFTYLRQLHKTGAFKRIRWSIPTHPCYQVVRKRIEIPLEWRHFGIYFPWTRTIYRKPCQGRPDGPVLPLIKRTILRINMHGKHGGGNGKRSTRTFKRIHVNLAFRPVSTRAFCGAESGEPHSFHRPMDIVAARSIGLKPSSMSIACENYHRGGFRRGKTL